MTLAEITALISALRAETANDSIDPERVGYIMQQILLYAKENAVTVTGETTVVSSGLTADEVTAMLEAYATIAYVKDLIEDIDISGDVATYTNSWDEDTHAVVLTPSTGSSSSAVIPLASEESGGLLSKGQQYICGGKIFTDALVAQGTFQVNGTAKFATDVTFGGNITFENDRARNVIGIDNDDDTLAVSDDTGVLFYLDPIAEPTEGSLFIMTSGDIYNALLKKRDLIGVIEYTGEVQIDSLTPNTMHVIKECTDLTIAALAEHTAADEFMLDIQVSEDGMTTQGLDWSTLGVVWGDQNEPEFAAGYGYQISILNGVALYTEYSPISSDE